MVGFQIQTEAVFPLSLTTQQDVSLTMNVVPMKLASTESAEIPVIVAQELNVSSLVIDPFVDVQKAPLATPKLLVSTLVANQTVNAWTQRLAWKAIASIHA